MTTTPTRRPGLFRYFDGDRDRYGDALVIQFRLQNASPGGDINKLDELLERIGPPAPSAESPAGETTSPEPATTAADSTAEMASSMAAMMELAPIIGAGFDLPAFNEADGTGLLIQERVSLLIAFYAAQAAELESASVVDEAATDLDDQAAA